MIRISQAARLLAVSIGVQSELVIGLAHLVPRLLRCDLGLPRGGEESGHLMNHRLTVYCGSIVSLRTSHRCSWDQGSEPFQILFFGGRNPGTTWSVLFSGLAANSVKLLVGVEAGRAVSGACGRYEAPVAAGPSPTVRSSERLRLRLRIRVPCRLTIPSRFRDRNPSVAFSVTNPRNSKPRLT
jgi:hypothetical protein